MVTAKRRPKVPVFFLRRIWLVWTDHTVAGVYASKKAAVTACKMRLEMAVDGFDPSVVGPYVLAASGLEKWRMA